LDKTQERLGTSKFFEYSSFTESGCNCQGLVANLLRTEGLYSDEAHKFVYQDVSGIYKELHSYVPKVADATTKAIALASKWFNIGGEKEGGVHDFFDGEYENEPVTLNSLVGGKYFSKNPDLEFLKYANEHKHDLEGPHTIKQMYKDWEEMRGGSDYKCCDDLEGTGVCSSKIKIQDEQEIEQIITDIEDDFYRHTDYVSSQSAGRKYTKELILDLLYYIVYDKEFNHTKYERKVAKIRREIDTNYHVSDRERRHNRLDDILERMSALRQKLITYNSRRCNINDITEEKRAPAFDVEPAEPSRLGYERKLNEDREPTPPPDYLPPYEEGGNKASGFIQAMMARQNGSRKVKDKYKKQVEQMNGRRRKPITTKELNRQKFQDFDAEGFRMKKMSKTTHDVANNAPPSKKPAEAFYEYVKQHAPPVQPPVIKNSRGQVIKNYRGTYDLDNMYSAWKSGRAPITESPSAQVAEIPEVPQVEEKVEVKEEKVEPVKPKRKIKVAEPEPEEEKEEVKEEEKKETKEERKARHDAKKAKNEEIRAKKAKNEEIRARKAEKKAKKAEKEAEKEAKKKARENETPEEKRKRKMMKKMLESNKKADAERAEMFRKAEEEAKAERERERLFGNEDPQYDRSLYYDRTKEPSYYEDRSLAVQTSRREAIERYNKEQRKIRKAEMKSKK